MCLVSHSSHTGFCGLFSETPASNHSGRAAQTPAAQAGHSNSTPTQPHLIDKSIISHSQHFRKRHKKQLSSTAGAKRDPGRRASQFGAAKRSAARQKGKGATINSLLHPLVASIGSTLQCQKKPLKLRQQHRLYVDDALRVEGGKRLLHRDKRTAHNEKGSESPKLAESEIKDGKILDVPLAFPSASVGLFPTASRPAEF